MGSTPPKYQNFFQKIRLALVQLSHTILRTFCTFSYPPPPKKKKNSAFATAFGILFLNVFHNI